jgi:CPA2 family monovalent cation:H+ antiporter-2
MTHETSLIATIAAALVLAFALGFGASRLRLPPIVGYLLAGIVIGPFTPGFVGDAGLASQLADIGVILLMFGVGLHFSPRDLARARGVALPGAAIQIVVATALGAALARMWNWSWAGAIVFGLALSVASTVVVLRTLEPKGILETPDGRLAVGWLVVEDLVMVLALVLIPALAPAASPASGGLGIALLLTLGKFAAFVILMAVAGRRFIPWLLTRVARTGSHELFMLGVLAVALGIAIGAASLFSVSFALGAFMAGIVVGESDVAHHAAAEALPLQDAFAVLFFVSVGMLVNPVVFVSEIPKIVAVLVVILAGQALAAALLVLAFRRPLRTALTVGAAVGQIGEFSFIVAALGVSLGVMPPQGRDLILAGALVSIALNPLLFAAIGPMERWIEARPLLLRVLVRTAVTGDTQVTQTDESIQAPSGHVIIVGYGRVGSAIGDVLRGENIPFVVVERDRDTVERIREAGVVAIFGDGASRGMLRHARVSHAKLVVVTAPEPLRARLVIEEARRENPEVDLVVRAHTEDDAATFQRLGVGRVVMGERELAFGMARYALQVARARDGI